MPHDRLTNRVELDVGLGRQPAAGPPPPETPFCIAVLGDFSGRGARGSMEVGRALVNRQPVLVDRDNFDQVLTRFAPRLDIPLGSDDGARLTLRFATLDDFHPDRLYATLPIFDAVREMRERLADPAVFARIADARKPRTPARPAESSGPPSRIASNLLDEIVGGSSGSEMRPAPRKDDLQEFIDRAVEPHLVPRADPGQQELLEQLDAATSAGMRAILHHPDFQALEALWRSVLMLVRRVVTDARLQVHLIDVAEAELRADLAAEGEGEGEGDGALESSGLYRLLVESSVGTPGANPWSLLIGNYTFGPGSERALGRLARLARMAGAPWIAGADPRLAGCPAIDRSPDPDEWERMIDPDWEAFRRSEDARYVGLALPRVLLRLPYGEETEPGELFPLEEMGAAPAHEDYLWGNAAIACALLLATSFASSGWSMRPGEHLDIDGLPLHVIREDGETTSKPCAEALLTERAALRLLDSGLMPLVSMKASDAVRLVRFQSVAHPSAALAGRWRQAAHVDRS
jgi:type VI secretion system protein ImpC